MSGPQEASFRDEAADQLGVFRCSPGRRTGVSRLPRMPKPHLRSRLRLLNRQFYREPGGGTMSEPEPGTNEWMIETGNYVDAEPDWDAPVPVDHYHGKAYPEAEPETGPAPEPPELEAGL